MHSLKLLQRLVFLLLLVSISAFARIDESIDIFFPKSLRYIQVSQTEFPVFWWNFIVIDPQAGAADFTRAEKLCADLHALKSPAIQHLVCGDDLKDYTPILTEWAHDVMLRENFLLPDSKPEAYRSAISESLAELSYLSSSNAEIWQLKRQDPTDQWQIFLKKNLSMSAQRFERKQGFLIDPQSQRLVIPLQFSVLPKMSNVQDVANVLENQSGVHWLGAHASAYTNEKQVHKDLDLVSMIGLLVLIGFIVFLVLKGRVGALLLFPPVAISMLLASLGVMWIDGSIHGLTLAFGSGIISLAIDYGLHSAFNSQSQFTWRSNTIGLFTTLVGLLVLSLSGIPLIRQMMLFASLGIFFGFLSFYILSKAFPRFFQLQPLEMNFPDFKGSGLLIVFLIIGGAYGASQSKFSFDITKFNFQSHEDSEAMRWFFTQDAKSETFLLLHDKADLGPKVSAEQDFAKANHVQYEGLGFYLPSSADQQANILSWNQNGCQFFQKKLSAVELKVFKPFMDNVCAPMTPLTDFEAIRQRPYLNHLVGTNQFLSMFVTKDENESKLLRQQFPEAHSMTDSVISFSNSMNTDIAWMIPAVFILCTLVLVLYYRNFLLVLASYIPFLSGLGLFCLIKMALGESLDLISVLGLLMVFGFSVDYGVFVTDIFAFKQDRGRLEIVYSVLTLAALTNVIGFFPLVFAKHPILHQLGSALFFGTIGTYLGTRWGLEKFLRRFLKERTSS